MPYPTKFRDDVVRVARSREPGGGCRGFSRVGVVGRDNVCVTGRVRRGMGVTLTLCAAPAVLAVASAIVLACAAPVVRSLFTSPVSITALTACCLTLAVFAGWLRGSGQKKAVLPLMWISSAVAVWFAMVAAMTWWVGVEGVRGFGAVALVTAAGAMPVAAVTALIWFALDGCGQWRRVLLLLATPTFLLEALFIEPKNPWEPLGPPASNAVGGVVAGVFLVAWTIIVVAAPIVLWRRAARSLPVDRAGRTLSAVASTAPLLGIGLTSIGAVLLGVGAEREALGSLAVAGLCGSFLLGGVCLALARSIERPLTRSATRALVLSVAVPPVALVAVVSSAPVVHAAGRNAIASTLIVLASGLVVAVAATPLIAWMLRGATVGHAKHPPLRPLLGASRASAPEPVGAVAMLSARETAVAEGLARGLSNAAIARELTVSERTVHAHVRSIYAKIGVAADGEHNQRVIAARALRGDSAELPMRKQTPPG